MTADLGADLTLHLRDQPSEVPVRPHIAGGAGDRQQPLRLATPTGLAERVEHDLADRVRVLRHRRAGGAFLIELPGLMGEHLALHRLRVHTADIRGGAIRPQTRVRVHNIHVLPR